MYMPYTIAMHIVIDARSRPSSTGKYIDRLLEHLQNIDKDNTYTVLVRPGDSWQPIAKNFSTKPCPFKQFSFNPLDQLRFGLWLRKLKADVVHFGMTPQEPLFYFGRRVTTTHDLTMLRFTRAGTLPSIMHQVRMVGYKILLRCSLRKAKVIITPTQYVAKDISTVYPFAAKRIVTTHEASEPPLKSKPSPISSIKMPFILYVGSAFPHKNLEMLIEAFSILHAYQPDLKLVLAGKKEWHYEQLEKLVKGKPIKNAVVFTGFVSDAQLMWLYKNAATYVFPSLSEGFGLPGLEAMVHGCPVASSHATCLPEVYGTAAHYFDPSNPQDMAQKIQEVVTDTSLRNALIKQGYRQAKKYSWRKMAEQTLEIYQKTAKE
jgi:glycosyltransferase involved in cell wall biosynthesis